MRQTVIIDFARGYALQKCLLIETSGKRGQIGLADASGVIHTHFLEEKLRHAKDLASSVQRLLQEADWKAKQLDGILVSLGPGSFTGLRVGIISAMSLAYAIDCPIWGLPTFSIIAQGIAKLESDLDILADALQGKIYCQTFGWAFEPGYWIPKSALMITEFASWVSTPNRDIYVTGPGLTVYANKLQNHRIAAEIDWLPRLSAMWDLVRKQNIPAVVDRFTLEPIYLRGSSAEEKRAKLVSG